MHDINDVDLWCDCLRPKRNVRLYNRHFEGTHSCLMNGNPDNNSIRPTIVDYVS